MVNQSLKLKTPRWWDALSAFLLVCAMLTAATRLVVTRWTDDLYMVQTLAFLGVLSGLALGQSRFSPKVVSIFSVFYTIFMIPWQLGITEESSLLWKDRISILANRITNTISLVVQSKPVDDNILFLFLMCILFWALSLYAGYTLTRYGAAWRSVLPVGLAVMVVQSYDPYLARRAWFLAAYLLFGLILIARMNYVYQRRLWAQNRAHMPPDIGFDWIRFTLAFVVALTLFAWTVPAMASTMPAANQVWQLVRRPWATLQDRFSNAFTSLKSSVGVVNEYYGSTMSLSRGSSLSDSPVFSVLAPPRPYAGDRYYWKAYSYDQYQDGRWTNTLDETSVIRANTTPLPLPKLSGRVDQTFTIKPFLSIATLYTPSQPLKVDQQTKAIYGTAEDGTVDIVSLTAQPIMSAGSTYKVTSSISAMSVNQLRGAGTNYPQWIVQNYLELPSDITPRTRLLAQQISNGLTDPYDIATAITSYLRTYKYSDVISTPPSNQELIDWWLFDYRQGFCQYYASAEVILLRSVGIPARMSVGYAEGQLIQPNSSSSNPLTGSTDQAGQYVIRQKDAHAWPEVYFPGYGWVEFEPTASQAPILRPEDTTGSGGTVPNDNLDERGPSRIGNLGTPSPNVPAGSEATLSLTRQVIFTIAMLIIVTAIFGSIMYLRSHKIEINLQPLPIQLEKGFDRIGVRPPNLLRRWADYARLSPVVRAYLEINRALSRLGKAPAIYDTPSERAKMLVSLVPATADPTHSLLSEYHLIVYSQKPADSQIARQAGSEIRKLSYLAILQRLIARFQEPASRVMRRA